MVSPAGLENPKRKLSKMKIISSQEEISRLSSRGLITFCCLQCSNYFYRSKNRYLAVIKGKSNNKLLYCSKKCLSLAFNKKISKNCKNCHKTYEGSTKGIFCNRSCAASYNNKHKTKGSRRSKLEIWLEQQLTNLYPNLEIHYNKKETISSELDIYIPSLKLAIELNGIFHYEPIYGQDKLNQIQNNDQNKFQQCQKLGISLCIIDVSNLKYFKPCKAEKYLHIICNLLATYGVSSKTT